MCCMSKLPVCLHIASIMVQTAEALIGRLSLAGSHWQALIGSALIGRLSLAGSRWQALVGRLSLAGSRWQALVGRLSLAGSRWQALVGRLSLAGSRWQALVGRLSLAGSRWQALIGRLSLAGSHWQALIGRLSLAETSTHFKLNECCYYLVEYNNYILYTVCRISIPTTLLYDAICNVCEVFCLWESIAIGVRVLVCGRGLVCGRRLRVFKIQPYRTFAWLMKT